LAIKRAFPSVRVDGVDQRDKILALAKRRKAIDEAAKDLRQGVADSDLVILAMPVDRIVAALKELGKYTRPGALITDVGSTKAEICRVAARHLPRRVYFIGGHPMAGKEQSGFAAAEASLFQGATYALCPQNHVPSHIARALVRLVRATGARPLIVDPVRHDQVVAYTSHLPQLLSIGLANVLGAHSHSDTSRLTRSLSGGALRDMTRLAASPFEVWHGICRSNRKNIARAIDEYIQRLRTIKARLSSEVLQENFVQANLLHRKERRRAKSEGRRARER
jgi:prephenate dehydrogenase